MVLDLSPRSHEIHLSKILLESTTPLIRHITELPSYFINPFATQVSFSQDALGAVPTGSEAFKHSLMTYSSRYTLEHVIHTSHKHTSLVGCNTGCGLFHLYHTGNQPASHTQQCCLSGRHEGQWRQRSKTSSICYEITSPKKCEYQAIFHLSFSPI